MSTTAARGQGGRPPGSPATAPGVSKDPQTDPTTLFNRLNQDAQRLRTEMNVPSRGWSHDGRRIDFTRWYGEDTGNMLMAEHLARTLVSDLGAQTNLLRQLIALANADPATDPALVLAIAYRESGPLAVSTSTEPVNTFGRGGLDFLGSQLPSLRPMLPPGYGSRWETHDADGNLFSVRNEQGRIAHPALVPPNELLVAYGVTIRAARETFLREATERGLDTSNLSPRALRAWTMAFFAAPGGRPFGSQEPGIGGVTAMTHLQRLMDAGQANGLNDILTNPQIRRYQIVQRGLVTAGEAELVSGLVTGNNAGGTVVEVPD
jgi:hypothetical protein